MSKNKNISAYSCSLFKAVLLKIMEKVNHIFDVISGQLLLPKLSWITHAYLTYKLNSQYLKSGFLPFIDPISGKICQKFCIKTSLKMREKYFIWGYENNLSLSHGLFTKALVVFFRQIYEKT